MCGQVQQGDKELARQIQTRPTARNADRVQTLPRGHRQLPEGLGYFDLSRKSSLGGPLQCPTQRPEHSTSSIHVLK